VLVKPKRKVPAKITEITGITQAMIDAEGVPSDVALDGLVAFIEDARLVMYNAPFDQAFLAALAARHGKSLQNPVSDALDMARRAFPGLPSYKLGNVAMSIGVTPNGKHRAAADCGMTKAVYETAVATLGTVD
jgi:DNA polymerase III alpha subunit (gram-positive type)